MTLSKFEHVKVKAVTTVVPEGFVDINDEIIFFNNDQKLLPVLR